ncbi:DEAD/DEAH box helicase [Plesiomonas sp.]|uniref:DEAD/DEAH box helicase n=1 Tax=Plesiomonas sp. TaxID=2486279 RepID=UPI003F2B202E
MALKLHPLHIELLCLATNHYTLSVEQVCQRVQVTQSLAHPLVVQPVIDELLDYGLLDQHPTDATYQLSGSGIWIVLRLWQCGKLLQPLQASEDDSLMASLHQLLACWAASPAALSHAVENDAAEISYWLDLLSCSPLLWVGLPYLPDQWRATLYQHALLSQIRSECDPDFWQQADQFANLLPNHLTRQAWQADAQLCNSGTLPPDHWFSIWSREGLTALRHTLQQGFPAVSGTAPSFVTLLGAVLLNTDHHYPRDPRAPEHSHEAYQCLRHCAEWAAVQGHQGLQTLIAQLAKIDSNTDAFAQIQALEQQHPDWGDTLLIGLALLVQGKQLGSALKNQPTYQHIMRYPPRAPLISLTQGVFHALAGDPVTHPLLNRFFPEGFKRTTIIQPDIAQHAEPELSLAALAELPQENSERVIWILEPKTKKLQAKIQKRGKKGWTKGRVVSIYNLRLEAERLLDEDDLKVYRATNPQEHYFYRDVMVDEPLLQALSLHPRVFLPEGEPLTLLPIQPLIRFEAQTDSDGVNCILAPRQAMDPGTLRPITADIWQFYQLPQQLAPLLRSFRRAPSALPVTSLPSLQKMIQRWPQQPWYSQHPALPSNIELTVWQPKLYLWLNWLGDGLEIQLFSQPQASWRHPLPAGKGDEWVVDPQNTLHWYQRDLAQELEQAQPWQTLLGGEEGQYQWRWQGSAAIGLLQQLQRSPLLRQVNVLWRKQSQRAHTVDVADLQLRVSDQKEWFALEGDITVDKVVVASLRQLLSSESRDYITLEDGQILLLTEQLQQHLAALRNLVNDDHSFNSQLAFPLQQLLGQKALDGDEQWQALTARWQQQVALPEPLLQQLRSYQREGVQWLAHLSEHGFGACLADDMGLGKTLQALTLLRFRQHSGPALVVAPKSVLHNWSAEIARFAPELNVLNIEQADDRAAMFTLASTRDIVLLSYGLIARCEEWLLEKNWSTAVLDEAQQIKNANTQRARSLFKLQAQARIALSGTPVENDLTELWSLFAFINPGLLGSKNKFTRQYATAVRDDESLQRLRALVSPFILRRTKKQVLTELPDKTEITHSVSLTEQEWALYEAARQQTLTELSDDSNQSGSMTLLAGLTRLRQICCHPRLSMADYQGPASKLEEALLLIDEALSGQHKVLIFSQFVGLLTLLRQQLDQRKLTYSYLDGSCSSTARQRAIDSFKAGEHPLFLISLKAGGTGLNLTEADTVIHLDPWWNPAVEDQASDRAHRMGQTQPVTVYRLVAEGTIEEKIVALHSEKRELADKVLSGQSHVDKIDSEQLFNLLQQ